MEAPGGPLVVRSGSPAPAELRPAAIVTAFNPASLEGSEDGNRRADRELAGRIREMGMEAWPSLAHGTGPDAARWDEPGWCLAGPVRAAAVALGAGFGQNAVVWIDPAGEVSIVCTRGGFGGARVGEALG